MERVYLADTLGIFSPDETARYVGLMVGHLARNRLRVPRPQRLRPRHRQLPGRRARGRARRPHQREWHGRAHGQRAPRRGGGRDPRPHGPFITGRERVAARRDVSRMVETFSGKDVAANTPIVGRDVFTQTAGIHADGDLKGDLYASRLARALRPETSLRAGQALGQGFPRRQPEDARHRARAEDRELVLQRIIELGDKKHTVDATRTCPTSSPTCSSRPTSSPARGALRRAASAPAASRGGCGALRRRKTSRAKGQRRWRLRRLHERAQEGARSASDSRCRSSRTSACAFRRADAPPPWWRP